MSKFEDGLKIVRKYMKKNAIPQRNGNIFTVQVLVEELSDDDCRKLVKLGWGGDDDWVSYMETDPIKVNFYRWFDKTYPKYSGEFDNIEMQYAVEQLALEAYLEGMG